MSASIKLDNVSLSIPLFLQQERKASNWASVLAAAIFDPPRRRLAHVLHDISLDIQDGDRVALLGQNGAGKSTLLKVINGIYAPTSGRMDITGRRQGLLNMSLGFNQEATVRENILLRGTAMGLDMDFLREKTNSILEFSGLQEKVNHRLRTLSSGQKMRLGFSISTSVRQDIILMDEWVGASDARFMVKAKERLVDHAQGSSIVVLATHTVGLLRDICNKGLLLDAGRVVFFGDLDSALKEYKHILANQWTQRASGEAGERMLGYVDHIAFDKGCLHLKGWMTGADGKEPAYLIAEIDGRAHGMSSIQRYDRPDVTRRFGLRNVRCGFKASFEIKGAERLEYLSGQLVVLAGVDADSANTELKLTPKVEAGLAAHGLGSGA